MSDLDKTLKRLQEELIQASELEDVATSRFAYLATKVVDGQFRLVGNERGLLRTAAHLVALARGRPGTHMHLDGATELDECERALVLCLDRSPFLQEEQRDGE